ncbi:MAG TPA: c-type cytochrome [Burkholderiaceae bacterium]|jgi:cytochrome c553|nr:c-type cytochrome [Burkholderiaceae bacterium]
MMFLHSVARIANRRPRAQAVLLANLLACALAWAGVQAHAETPAAPVAKPDLAKGSTTSTTVCGACHVNDGSRGVPTYPILEGQHADYLVKELTEFKEGKRANAIMKPMASMLSPEDMRNVAAFYESKVAKPGSATHKETVDQARAIWKAGIPERKVPACAGCHGPTGAGIPAQYPRLGGQWAPYTEAQLTNFRSGQRANSPQMQAIAARLSDNEIKALADFMGGLR